ncbi:MAG: FGGY family pentulose kinase [Rhizobiaceae bacterium]
MRPVVCAVDVGTGSARAGIFDTEGNLLGRDDAAIEMRQVRPGEAEHDSEQIWKAVGAAVRAARETSGAAPEDVRAIAFDATCSLVVRDADGGQLPVSPDGERRWDTIVWLDHRALEEAGEATATRHPALAAVGGTMPPEMQIPKLMWLKRRLPETWNAAHGIFDLSDFLAFRASGSGARSQSTLACKWNWRRDMPGGWPAELLETLGISDMAERAGLSAGAVAVGSPLGTLTPEAAATLGLTTGCLAGAGMVDAYAGALGKLGYLPARDLETHAALIAGTSSCVMFASAAPTHFGAVWGPFPDAALPGRWMSEAGQSVSGALLDHMIRLRGMEPNAATHRRIAERIGTLRLLEGADFAGRLHVLPDFHGNRAPFGDARALGVVHGLALDTSFDSLCRLYWRTCVAIALGIRHILDALRQAGREITTLHIAGGHLKNPLMMELYANALGCRVMQSAAPEAVLLGTAMAAAAAGGLHENLGAAARAMGKPATPRDGDPTGAAYERDYRIFLEMHRHRQQIDRI